jgi:hypothetical protein
MARKQARRWSQRVTRTSNALDLESGVFPSLSAPDRKTLTRAKQELHKLYGRA